MGLPRVYALTLDFISHTDARIDLDTLVKYVAAYQEGRELTIGELWAVPIMLRLGLLQSVRKLAEEEVFTAEQRSKADAWAERMVRRGEKRGSEVVVTLAELATSEEPLSSPFLVQLIRRLREHDALVSSASHWVHERCAEMGTSPEVLARAEHLRQAENQVSIGNAITSMRAIAALDWNEFFERTSLVEQILEVDPAGAYVETDAASRDRYRHAVEDLAKRGRKDEVAVARLVVDHARQAASKAGGDPRATHVGFWLVDEGRALLEAEVGYRAKLLDRVRGLLQRRGATFYLGSIAAGSVLAALFFTTRQCKRRPLSWLALFLWSAGGQRAVSRVPLLVTCSAAAAALPNLCLTTAFPQSSHPCLVRLPFQRGGLHELC